MDAWAKALQPVSDPNFIDHAFKEDPRGVTFRQWQPIEPMLDSYGRQLETEDANNHGGSSQGSQTAMEPYFRRIFSTGHGDTNGTSNNNGSSSDTQDVNSALQGPSGARANRHRTDNVRAMNKLAQQRYRERQRQNLQNLQNKQTDYADTVEKLEQVNLSNRDLEVEKQRLEAELNELNGLQQIRPSAPAASNGYSDSDSNHSSTAQSVFTTRVGRNITVKPAHAVKYRKTEQAWFAKIEELRACMESIGFWARGPSGNSEELSQGKLAKLGGALQGVVELCCEVAKMEGVEMKQLLNRTYETCSNIRSWKDSDRWFAAADALKLSAEQKQNFMSYRLTCLERLKELYADRQRLSALVVENLLPSDGGLEDGDPGSGPQGLNTITMQLEENLKEEQRFNCRMLYSVFKVGLNPVQAGWLILQSFPEHVDVLAFMNAIDDLYGKPTAQA
ncbi:hypothetical protein ABBQ38_011282 [Trebouxia sp. C0009 RCD-2024]